MKEQSLFTESRPVMFQRLYAGRFAELHRKLFSRAPRANRGVWSAGATLTRVRSLARKMARADMKDHRDKVREDSAK